MSSILEIFNLLYCHVCFIAGEGLQKAQVEQCGRKAADAQEGQGKIIAEAHLSYEDDEDESYNRSQPPLPPAPVPTFQDSVGEVLQSFADDSRIVIQQSPVWHDAVVAAEALHAQICGRSRRSASAQSASTVGAYHASVQALRRVARGLVQPSTRAPRPDVATQASPVAPRRLPNMSDYEWSRAQNIYRNKRKLQSMGLPYE